MLPKMEKGGPKTVDDYIENAPPSTKSYLLELRKIVRETAPEAVEGIGYQMPAYKYLGRPLVYFGGFKKHVSLFAAGSERIGAKFKEELKGYVQSKGTIQFPLDKPLPEELIAKVVKERVREVEEKSP